MFTGLRNGEKVHEVLVGRSEVSEPTSHELINRVWVPSLEFTKLPRLDRSMGEAALLMELRNLCEPTLESDAVRPPAASGQD